MVGEGDRFSFTPSNPWVAVGWRKPADVEMPVAAYLAKKKIAFEGAGAEKVEPDANRIVLRDGRTLDYDYLLIATGPRLAFDEIPGLGPAAPEQWATSSLSHPFQPPAFTQQEQQILDLIESFGEALERSLYFGDPWPSSWRGNPQIARQLLLAVSFNVNEVRDFPLTKYIQVSGNLTGFIRSPLHQQDAHQEAPVGRIPGRVRSGAPTRRPLGYGMGFDARTSGSSIPRMVQAAGPH